MLKNCDFYFQPRAPKTLCFKEVTEFDRKKI